LDIREVIVNGMEPSAYFLKQHPHWRPINSGICFNVFEDNVTHHIFKLQSLRCGSEQIKEIKYWSQYCIEHQHVKYLPQFSSCVSYQFDRKKLFCIESEKLDDIETYSALVADVKFIFNGYIAKAFIELTDNDITIIMGRIRNSIHFSQRIDSEFEPFFIKLLTDLRQIARRQGDTIFSLDFHFNNFMIRPSTGQLVIVDAFSCSMYNE
jgi:hypothetical protein